MYFYEPQWLFNQVKLVKVNLPAYTEGCDSDPKKIACDYPPYELDKIVSKKFAETGGKAYELVKNFSWSNEDQNAVATTSRTTGCPRRTRPKSGWRPTPTCGRPGCRRASRVRRSRPAESARRSPDSWLRDSSRPLRAVSAAVHRSRPIRPFRLCNTLPVPRATLP